eukprot:Em0004g1328a
MQKGYRWERVPLVVEALELEASMLFALSLAWTHSHMLHTIYATLNTASLTLRIKSCSCLFEETTPFTRLSMASTKNPVRAESAWCHQSQELTLSDATTEMPSHHFKDNCISSGARYRPKAGEGVAHNQAHCHGVLPDLEQDLDDIVAGNREKSSLLKSSHFTRWHLVHLPFHYSSSISSTPDPPLTQPACMNEVMLPNLLASYPFTSECDQSILNKYSHECQCVKEGPANVTPPRPPYICTSSYTPFQVYRTILQ